MTVAGGYIYLSVLGELTKTLSRFSLSAPVILYTNYTPFYTTRSTYLLRHHSLVSCRWAISFEYISLNVLTLANV